MYLSWFLAPSFGPALHDTSKLSGNKSLSTTVCDNFSIIFPSNRQTVIEKNLLDTVIGLPANLFYGTSIPACVLIFRKNRNRDDVLFIDASGKDEKGNIPYRKDKNQNRLETKHIEDIVKAYENRRDIENFAHVATSDEIKANEYNLNIPRYVDTFEEEALVDIDKVKTNISNIQKELAEVEIEIQMAKYLKELGL